MNITIWHNPKCGTSRDTLAAIRAAGHEPAIVEYLQTPPTRAELARVIARIGLPIRDVVRAKEPLYAELKLDGASDDQLLDAMAAHPILINRPIVQTDKGAALCRPSETIKTLL